MSRRLRLRLLLVIAACVVGAGVASATIQRSASNADFGEYEGVNGRPRRRCSPRTRRCNRLLHERSERALTRFNEAQPRLRPEPRQGALARRGARRGAGARPSAAPRGRLDAPRRLGAGRAHRSAPPRAGGPRGPRRTDLLQAFLATNAELLDELARERKERQAYALRLPIALIALLTLLSAALLWVGVERPARSESRRRGEQDELAAALQVSRSEPEAYDVLSRHLRRSTHSTQVTILNRNNSADRLEPVTPVTTESAVAAGLEGASPDSCLAIRMAAPHKGEPGGEGLLMCEVCGKSPERTTCLPSLVGGEVIGSVLVEHHQPFGEESDRQIAESVAEAAPVIANLRNLAIAEMRAATDGLTGLPNQRAVHETLKRMVAQAGRTMEPLAMILFDLDRFKAINDTFGHGRGDDVLAAVGDVAAHTIRGSDFVGRLGGEEFAVLLPGTSRDGALQVAENMREAIGGLVVAGVDRTISASFGVAILPDDAPEAQALLRVADRALYQAKANGRDRVEMAAV